MDHALKGAGEDTVWSRHVVDIYEAVRQGLDRDIDMLCKGMADPDAWAQEYELQWLDEASSWLDYDLIGACEHPAAGLPGLYQGGPCFVGVDIAARNDLFVIWVMELVGDVLWTREVTKAANDNANARAYKATTITGAGLATGGGALDANRVITVTDASQAEAEAGTATNRAMSPLRVAQALAVHGVPAAAAVTDLNDVIGSGFAAANVAPANSPWDYPGVMTVRRANQRMGQIAVPTNSAGVRLAARSQSSTGVWGAWLEAWLGQPAAQSLGTSGYQRLPSGLLIQWGQFTGTTSATLANNGVYESDPVTVTWPVAFTTLFQVIPGASADVTGFGQQEQVWRRSAGLTSGSFAVASRTSGATMTGSYLVIGV